MHSMFDERQWLAWLVKVRIIILTFLLGIELAIARLTPTTVPLRLFVNAILLWYTVSIFYLLLLSVWHDHKIQSLLQVLTDLILVTLVVHLTGGMDSSLNFLYPLVIIVAAILLPRLWTYLSAAFAFLLYGSILNLSYFEIIPSYSATRPEWRTLQAVICVNLFAYITVAYLTGLLSGKLRQVDTKLKHASGALQDLQALHENIIDSMSGGLITTGLDGRITVANTAALRALDRTSYELLDEPVESLFLDPLPQPDSERTLGEVRFIAPNKFRKTFRVKASALVISNRGPIGHVYTFDDITEIRRLERDLRMQDRLAAVGRLAAGIAHEIRNPLTSIAGSVSMLTEVPNLNQEQRQLLQIVTRESERLNGIITDFLAYSRNKKYVFNAVDLIPLLEDTLTLLEHRLRSQNSRIRLDRRYSVNQAIALADGDRMKQVFWNFCENAIRAMKDEGVLTVSVDRVDREWELSFADTGPGISPQLIEKIFEPFQSQFEGGTGLGLAIVYQIVQAHDGKVWARSRSEIGSVFVLRLGTLASGSADTHSGGRTVTNTESTKALAAAASAGEVSLHG